MKRYKLLIIAILCVPFVVFGQDLIESEVTVAAHYVEQEATMDVYCFSTENEVMIKLLGQGFILERSDDGVSFEKIAEIHHADSIAWKQLLEETTKPKDKKFVSYMKTFIERVGYYDILSQFNSVNASFEDMYKQKTEMGKLLLSIMLKSMQDKEMAKLMGVFYTDTSIEKGKTYYYRAKPLATFTEYKVTSKPAKVTATAKIDYTKKIDVLQGDGTLGFSWEQDNLVGYFVERKAYNETEFKALTDRIQFTSRPRGYKGEVKGAFDDKGLENYKPYTYRFYANTFWGEKVLFGEVTAHAVDRTPPPAPFLPQPKHTKPDEVTVSWKVQKETPDLLGFVVARSTQPNGDFQVLHDRILPKNIRNFVDKSFRTDTLNYYMVQAIDTARNISSSNSALVVLIDSIPPKKPVFVQSAISKKGEVTLEVKKNEARDLMGYRLYKSNSPEHEFSVIYEGFKHKGALDTIPTVFTDTTTLKTLTPYVYYRVKALDTHYNESEFSEIVKLKRPDTIPPATPVFKKVEISKNKVVLSFALSPSEDVVSQMIYRRENKNEAWQLLDSLTGKQTAYTDTKVAKGTTYYYSLRAKDDSGLFSAYATPVFGRPYDNGVRTPVSKIKIKKQDDKLLLSWEYPQKNADTFFIVYKSNKKGQLLQYKRTEALQLSIPYTGKADYGIKVFTKDGGQSVLSKTVTK